MAREWQLAGAAADRHDLNAAAAHLDHYVAARPDDPAGWFLAARTARRLERFADAARHLERCQKLGGVTDATRLEWDLQRVQQGDTAEPATRLRQTIGPDHPDALLVLEALARGYVRNERPVDAIEACNLWIARQPDHPWPYLWRGTVYERLGHLDRAQPDFERAVARGPGDREARLALAGLYLRKREPAAAAEQYEAALARDRDDTQALTGLAASRLETGRAGEAVPLLDRVVEIDPGSAAARHLRGKVLLEQGRPAEAIPWLREAVRLAPYHAEAYHQLAQALRAVGRGDEADPADRQAEDLRAAFTRLDDLARQSARAPADPRPRQEAGDLALRVGRTEEGVRWLRSVLALPGDHPAAHAALAEHYRRAGDPDRADYHARTAGPR